MTADSASALTRIRTLLLADEDWQIALAALVEPEAFIGAAVAGAISRGVSIDAATIEAKLHPDPLGLTRVSAAWQCDTAPPRHWLPTRIIDDADGPLIEWLHFAGTPLSQPFYSDSIQRVRALPFNRLMQCITPLSALDPFADAPPPDGLIFHMSRCGSTLVAQMIGAVAGHVVVSEPPPLDTLIQFAGQGRVSPSAIARMTAALTRDRNGDTRHRFVKLDAWHILAMPMLRMLWPDVPWVFLYRDPIEVLVSQQRMPGVHAVPGMIPLNAFGVAEDGGIDHRDYAAWLLGLICKAALDANRQGGGLLVNYDGLPTAVTSAILPHLGLSPDVAGQSAMAAVASRNSKAPDTAFATDSASKQRQADAAIRTVADRHLTETYRALEYARTG